MKMSSVLLILSFLGVLSYAQDVQSLIKSKGCLSCHDTEKSKVGPSFKVIAKEYKGNPEGLKILVQSLRNGSVGKWQNLANKYGITITSFYMPRQPVSEEEAKKIAEWILSLEK